jgi:Glycine cleavage system P-protein
MLFIALLAQRWGISADGMPVEYPTTGGLIAEHKAVRAAVGVFDIVALEGQSFGLAPSYGGPFVGVIATHEKFVRQLPGRLAGQQPTARAGAGSC